MTEREAELTATIEQLIWGMHLWGCDEDNSIHPDAYGAFCAALTVARIPVTITHDSEDHETRYRFDHDWCRRMREATTAG